MSCVLSRSVVSDSLLCHGLQPTRLLCPWGFFSKNPGVRCHALLQGIFPNQGLNPGFPHCRQILYCLSYQGRPCIVEWGAYPFYSGAYRPRNEPGSPALQVDSLPTELSGKHVRRWILYQLSYQGSKSSLIIIAKNCSHPYHHFLPAPLPLRLVLQINPLNLFRISFGICAYSAN